MLTHLVFGIIVIVLNFVFLNYVDKLEKIKCDCSKDWKRDFIKVYSILVIIIITCSLFLDVRKLMKNDIILAISTLFQLAGFIYLYCLYSFTRDLKKDGCNCSDTWERRLMYTYSIVIIILYLLTVAMNLGVILFVTSPRFDRVCREVSKIKASRASRLSK